MDKLKSSGILTDVGGWFEALTVFEPGFVFRFDVGGGGGNSDHD
jgi:hypothetical protein